MYEFDYISAASASVENIKEARNRILHELRKELSKVGVNSSDLKNKKIENPYTENSIDEVQILINTYIHMNSGLNVCIAIDKLNDDDLQLKHFEKLIQKSKALGLKLNVYVSGYSKFGNER